MRISKSSTHIWGMLTMLSAVGLAARPAAAQECTTDADCGAGYVCQTEQYESCKACPDGGMCSPDMCETGSYSYCTAAPCTADADCPDGMLCYAPTYTECSPVPTCDPNVPDCMTTQVDAGDCQDVTGSATCTLRYELPCHADADCGPGFTCEARTYTVCSGGGMGGSGAVDGGVAVVDAGSATFECHQETSDTSYCNLLELPCDTTDDCPAGLECLTSYSYGACDGGVADAGVGMTSGGTMTSGGSTTPAGDRSALAEAVDAGAACGQMVETKLCMPPGGGGRGGTGGGGAVDAGSADGMGTGTGNGGSDSSGSPQDAGTSTGSGGSQTGGGAGAPGDQHEEHHHGRLPHLGFGCAVAADGHGTQPASFFSLIGLVALALRRRARRT